MANITVLHVTDASSAGVLSAVTTIARQQSQDPRFSRVVFAYVLRPDSPSEEEIRQMAGSAVEVQRWSDQLGARRLVDMVRILFTMLRSETYDVVHLHSSRAGLLGRWVALATPHRGRSIYSPHAFAFAYAHWSRPKRLALLALELLGAIPARRLVLNSSSEEDIARRALPGAQTSVLVNAVDVARLRDLERSPNADHPWFAHVGRIAPAKAPGVFSAVTELVTGRVQGSRSLWLGDGDRTLLDGTHVEVSGWLTTQELHARLSSISALLFTSRGEGMPMAVLEAQAMGIPVVASRVTGVVDLIDDGKNGLLGETVEELADALTRVLTEPELAEHLAAQTRTAAERFDQSATAQRSLECYAFLLSARLLGQEDRHEA